MREHSQVIYAFIDSQNLNLGIKTGLGWNLDFKRFRVFLKDKFKVEKAFLFIGYMPGNESLYASLQECNYLLIFKPTLLYKKGSKKIIKGNVDAELVLHAMIHYKNYDKAVIVSGDGDFYCLVEHLEKNKKLARLIIPNKQHYSALLRKFRKYIWYFSKQDEKKLSIQKKEREYPSD